MVAIPKFLILDRFLAEKGVYLLAQKVQEGPLSLRLSSVKIYLDNRLWSHWDYLEVSPSLGGIKVIGKCSTGSMEVFLGIGWWRVEGKEVRCIKDLNIKKVNLHVAEGMTGVFEGDIKDPYGLMAENLVINFKGKVFDLRAKVMGTEVAGSGQIVGDKINAVLISEGTRYLLSGNWKNLRIQRGP
ncbi:hypothetical protein [Thermocrinis albus]|nr:hypothetical protein [Thermocrinis albus]